MNQLELSLEIIATYRKHGWQLRRVLMTSETRTEADKRADKSFENVGIDDAPIDALWFSRASHKNREAWELRLVADVPYALFETFEADKTEEAREDVRSEMEARMREYAART
jgi:hypothetical protein